MVLLVLADEEAAGKWGQPSCGGLAALWFDRPAAEA